MKIYFTVKEGGYWHRVTVSRKELNKLLKYICLGKNMMIIMLPSQIYDPLLFKWNHSYYRKSYYKELESCLH